MIDPQHDMTVVSASRNLAEFLADPSRAHGTIGRSIGSVLGDGFAEAVRRRFQDGRLRGEAPWHSTLRLEGRSQGLDVRGLDVRGLDVSVHAHAGVILVELEQAGAQDEADALVSMRQLEGALIDLRGTGSNLADLARVTLRGARLLTGYERALIYRFDADGSGEALAEDKADDWSQSLKGLRFRAADIPSQARELHRAGPVRWVPDRDAVLTPLDVDPAWLAGRLPPYAIDLSFARLRPTLPPHLRRHRNMGVNGSMSLPIMHEERLWGLLVCHHRRPHRPSPGQRAAIAALADAFAQRISLAERAAAEQAREGELARLRALLAHMAGSDRVVPALTAGDINLCSLFDSIGAAAVYDGAVSLLGQTPPEAEVRKLTGWLRTRSAAKLFETDNLAAAFPSWRQHAAAANGVLAVFLSADQSDVLLWFRPEEPHLVRWGGDVRRGASEDLALPPGPLFQRWAATRRSGARPWAAWELEIAEALRHGVMDVIVRGLRRIGALHDELRRNQKMEAIGQLTGGVAHNFNNLLTGITGSLELMRIRVAQGRHGDLDRYIDIALTSADRGAALVHHLLAFSRRQTLDPKLVDLNQITTSMEELIRRTVGPAIHVETVTSGGLWRTFCDAAQLENALLILAANARHAMPSGGRLTIAASNAYLDEACASRHEAAPGHYATVSIVDTGVGMTPDVVARAFEPFFTTKPFGQGTGLGLSMVYGFAKQSNGSVHIHSEVGRGTTVRLYLPRHLAGEAEAGASEPLPGVVNVVQTVLVVDDEPVMRRLIGDVLRDLGYEVIEAAGSAEGLHVLRSVRDIGLLVSAVGLPGDPNGRQLAEAARAQRPQLKVLFISGHAESALLGDGVLEPGAQVLTKPFAPDVLAAKVQAMM